MRALLQVTRVGTCSFLFVQNLSLMTLSLHLSPGFFPVKENAGLGKSCLDSSPTQCKAWQRCRQWRGRRRFLIGCRLAVGHTSLAIFSPSAALTVASLFV